MSLLNPVVRKWLIFHFATKIWLTLLKLYCGFIGQCSFTRKNYLSNGLFKNQSIFMREDFVSHVQFYLLLKGESMKEISRSVLKSKIILGVSCVAEALLLIPMFKHLSVGSYSSAIGIGLAMFVVSFPLRNSLRNIREKTAILNVTHNAKSKK